MLEGGAHIMTWLSDQIPGVSILQPLWLILAIPLGVSLFLWRPRSPLLLGLRIAAALFLLLGLAELAIRRPSHSGLLVILADRSDSMPAKSKEDQKDDIHQIRKAMGDDDLFAVVSFGKTSGVEALPGDGAFQDFTHANLGTDASNLTGALETALSLVPRDTPAKILILSDGQWTGKNPLTVASRAATRNVSIDFRSPALQSNDVAIVEVKVPERVPEGEGFLITAWIQVPTTQEVTISLYRSDQLLFTEKRELPSGRQRVQFRDVAMRPGTQDYRVEVKSTKKDPVQANDRARALVGVQGAKPLLHVTRSGTDSGLAKLLQKSKVPLVIKKPSECNWTLEELSKYSAVLLENVPTTQSILHKDADASGQLSTQNMETISQWVQKTGAGLMITGGKGAYGSGGYYKSPLDPILPVSMELRQEHRKLTMAIVVALDRSGSMGMGVGGGKDKMDLANEGTAQVLDLMGPLDQLGVLAVDSSPHEIAPLEKITNKEKLRDRILRIDAGGGGIFVYVALERAVRMLAGSKAGAKHIILFADAADAEQPGAYVQLLEKCEKMGITVSVIGLGEKKDSDAGLLIDIAKRGKGRAFFTKRPEDLPRLFAQDTIVVARSTFLDEATTIQLTPSLETIMSDPKPVDKGNKPITQVIGGYNLCYPRKKANVGVLTTDEYKAPVVANWSAGLGRVVCYTGEADGEYVGAIKDWNKVGTFYAGMAQWAMGNAETLSEDVLLTQEIRNGQNVIQLHLDPERKNEPFPGLPIVTSLSSIKGEAVNTGTEKMRWVGPDTLELSIPLRDQEISLSTVEIPGRKPKNLTPVTLPYSPEHRPARTVGGFQELQRLSRTTGGKERVDLASIWKEVPRPTRMWPLTNVLLFLAMLLVLLEVLERRTSLVTQAQHLVWNPMKGATRRKWNWAFWKRRKSSPEVVSPKRSSKRVPGMATPAPAAKVEDAPAVEPVQAPAIQDEEVDGGLLGAIRDAKRRSKGKT